MRGIFVQENLQDTEEWRIWSFEGEAAGATVYD
jgi:hypothetical protein